MLNQGEAPALIVDRLQLLTTFGAGDEGHALGANGRDFDVRLADGASPGGIVRG